MGINEDELDKLAENAREEIDRLRGTTPGSIEEQKPTSPVPGSFTWNGQLMQTIASGPVGVAGTGGAGGWASQAGSQLTTPNLGGDYYDMAYTQTQTLKHDKGVCQESYDKGYADGLKALSTPPPSTD